MKTFLSFHIMLHLIYNNKSISSNLTVKLKTHYIMRLFQSIKLHVRALYICSYLRSSHCADTMHEICAAGLHQLVEGSRSTLHYSTPKEHKKCMSTWYCPIIITAFRNCSSHVKFYIFLRFMVINHTDCMLIISHFKTAFLNFLNCRPQSETSRTALRMTIFI
jgi:hypothetical protein